MDNNLYKQLKIDSFLKQIQLLSQTNKIDERQIYVQLINHGIPEIERRQNVSGVFRELQLLNLYNEKMDVFVASNWKYFLQFVSKNVRKSYHLNPIKIYIPLKYENMEKSVQRIFAFINKNNIEHCSKLASEVRVDDLVIRVYSKEDADKIINYINSDEELTKNMYNPNPFSIETGKVGLTMDRILSYNSTLAKYINSYINKVNSENLFASYDGFKYFLSEQLQALKSKEDLSNFIKMAESKNIKRLPQFLQTLEEITNVIIKVMNCEPRESLYRYFEEVNLENYNVEKYREYHNYDYATLMNENYTLLKNVVNAIAMKYGYSTAKLALVTYKNTGDVNYITRTNNARDMITSSKTFKTFLNIIDLDKEFERLMPEIKESQSNPSKERILEEICKSTYLSCQTPERGYCGKRQIARSLIRMQANDYNCITRTNNARKMAQEHIRPEEIKNIIKQSLEASGYIIENEADLYELYATHIEYLCNNKVKEGERNVKK